MRLIAACCCICGQPVLREGWRLGPEKRVVCGEDCRATVRAMDAGVEIPLAQRTCLACGEGFLADESHVGVARRRGVADVCPACWREGLVDSADRDPYLDSFASLWGAVWALVSRAARAFWEPSLPCPRCGEPAHRTYEWSCRYPLAVGICEGLDGPHVHSICARCGYETVRLQTKKAPLPANGRGALGQGLGERIPKSSDRMASRPASTTSLR